MRQLPATPQGCLGGFKAAVILSIVVDPAYLKLPPSLPPRGNRLVLAEVTGPLLDATTTGLVEICMVAAESLPVRASPHSSQGAGWGSPACFRWARGGTRAGEITCLRKVSLLFTS